jgi:hypothetical protein
VRTKTNWNERAVMALYYLAKMVEGVLYICSLGYIYTNLGGNILFSDWATDFTERGESK